MYNTLIETLIIWYYLMECNVNLIKMSSNEPVIPCKVVLKQIR